MPYCKLTSSTPDLSLADVKTYDPVYEDFESNGTIRRAVKYVERTDDPNRHYRASDFSLEVIIASGNTDLLKNVGKLTNPKLDAADQLYEHASYVESIAPNV